MAKKQELTAEAEALRNIYWNTMGHCTDARHMWQEMVDECMKMHYSKLNGMQKALDDLKERDVELLATIREELNLTGGIVDKNITWHYKEREKVLKNKAKLMLKITAEKKRLLEFT